MKQIGITVGRTSTKWVTVRLEKELESEVSINDLVRVGSNLLGVVRSTSYSNPTMSPYSPFMPSDTNAVRAFEYLNANVELYGMLSKEGFQPRVLAAIPTGSPVYLIEEGDLDDLNLVDNPINVGYHPTSSWPIPLNPNSVFYHVAVIGSTGSGKSHLVRLLIKELVKNGIKVLAFDHTGEDYAPHLNGNVVKDQEIMPDIQSMARVLADEVFEMDLADDVEIALDAYLKGNGSENEAIKYLKTLGLGGALDLASLFGKGLEAYQEGDPRDVKWEDLKFLQVLNYVMDQVKRRPHTKAKAFIRFLNSGVSLNSFNGRSYLIDELVDLIINDWNLTIIDISNEPLPIRFGIMKGLVSKVMRVAERRKSKINLAIVIDEAQIYASKGQITAPVLADVARRGRKWGVGLILVSQRWVYDIDPSIRANINSVLFSSLQASTDIEEIAKIVNVSNVDVDVLGQGDFYVTGLMSPFRRPILMHTYG